MDSVLSHVKGKFHENIRKRSASESDLGDDPTDAAVALVFFANFFLQTKHLFQTSFAQNIFVFFDNLHVAKQYYEQFCEKKKVSCFKKPERKNVNFKIVFHRN
jgi:hypothetical protein